jgi:hypothetical protein
LQAKITIFTVLLLFLYYSLICSSTSIVTCTTMILWMADIYRTICWTLHLIRRKLLNFICLLDQEVRLNDVNFFFSSTYESCVSLYYRDEKGPYTLTLTFSVYWNGTTHNTNLLSGPQHLLSLHICKIESFVIFTWYIFIWISLNFRSQMITIFL